MKKTAQGTTHGNAKNNGKSKLNSELIEQIKIENTPFIALRHGDDWYLAIGKYRLTEKLKSLGAVQREAKDASWIRIMQIIQIVIDENVPNIKKQIVKEIMEDHKGPDEKDENQIKLNL